jgi:peptidoglycan pentaglycine glycine transferase (the first glycine)
VIAATSASARTPETEPGLRADDTDGTDRQPSSVTSLREARLGAAAGEWNRAVLAAGGHLLQSWEWGAFKERHGWTARQVEVSSDDGDAYAQVLFRRKGPFSLAYVPRGPVLRGDGDRRRLFERLRMVLDDLCRAERALALVLEPDGALGLSGTYRDIGFVRGPHGFQPARSVKVPLADDQAILEGMHAKNRYSVRLALRRGVTVERGGTDPRSLELFYGLLKETQERNDFGIHDKSYYDDFMRLFGDRALMLFGMVDGQPATGLIAARFGDEAIYMYGGSSTVHRGDGAAFLLQYEAMRWARDQGCRRYDLWGIPDEDPAPEAEQSDGAPSSKGDDRRGLYTFKVRFGGEIVRYPKTMERRYVPVVAWVARRFALGRG